jgi:cbb3-type cytochrome oxidase cytochrome c subunit
VAKNTQARTSGTSQVVEASGSTGTPYTAAEIEAAMNEAAAQAAAEGISDPDEVRERKIAARQAFKDERRARASAEAEAAGLNITDAGEIEQLAAETRKRFEDQRRGSAKRAGR